MINGWFIPENSSRIVILYTTTTSIRIPLFISVYDYSTEWQKRRKESDMKNPNYQSYMIKKPRKYRPLKSVPGAVIEKQSTCGKGIAYNDALP